MYVLFKQAICTLFPWCAMYVYFNIENINSRNENNGYTQVL